MTNKQWCQRFAGDAGGSINKQMIWEMAQGMIGKNIKDYRASFPRVGNGGVQLGTYTSNRDGGYESVKVFTPQLSFTAILDPKTQVVTSLTK